MKKITILLLVVISLFSVTLTACGKKKDDNVVRISEVTHSLFYAPLYVAMNNGYFEDEGLEIELTNAGGSDAVTTALTSKSADIGLLGPESMIYVRNQGMKNAPVIFAQLTACDGSFLVGRPDENTGEFSYNDLIGKHVIAGRRGGMPAMTLQYILEEIYGLTTGESLDDADVLFDLSVSFNMVVPTFVAGTGDYCSMFEPNASQCQIDGTGVIVSALGEEVSNIPYTVFTATSSFLKNEPKKIEKFMRALQKGYDYLMTATDEQLVSALKPSFNTTSDELIVSAVRNYIAIGAYADDFVLGETAWEKLQEIMDHAGELDGNVAYTDAVNTSFASAV